jgi:hypothetical protein
MEKEIRIDLCEYFKKERILLSQESGEAFARRINLQKISQEYEKIIFVFPERIVVMNRAFFRGLFGKKDELGFTRDEYKKFAEKYVFKANSHIQKKVKEFYSGLFFNVPVEDIFSLSQAGDA